MILCQFLQPCRNTFGSRKIWVITPTVTWNFVEQNVPVFNPVTNKCKLCMREKFYVVLKPEKQA